MAKKYEEMKSEISKWRIEKRKRRNEENKSAENGEINRPMAQYQ